MPKRLFISFDYDNDEDLRVLLAGQAKLPSSPFEFGDASVKTHLTGDWEKKVRGRISRADVVAVICGNRTHTAQGVAIELQIARDLGKPYFLLSGRKTGTNTKPATALRADPIYDWTWPNLTALIAGER